MSRRPLREHLHGRKRSPPGRRSVRRPRPSAQRGARGERIRGQSRLSAPPGPPTPARCDALARLPAQPLSAACRKFVRVGIWPAGAPGPPRASCHCLWVVVTWVLGAGAGATMLLGTVLAGAVVVGTPTGAGVVGAGPDGGVDV